MEEEKSNTNKNPSISFTRLLPFLTIDIKRKLSKDVKEVKKIFVLHSEGAYKALQSTIKSDVERFDRSQAKPKRKWYDLPKW